MAGDSAVRSLLEKMTECASAAYLRMLERWVYEGVIDDPYGEFFIAENKSLQKESLTQDYDAKYWQQRYSLKDGIPSFLTNVAATILTTGKYLNVMRECEYTVQVCMIIFCGCITRCYFICVCYKNTLVLHTMLRFPCQRVLS
jgi:gamma-tubulin complex component 2